MPLSYLEWNDRLFTHYFNDEKRDTEVILYADEQIIEKIGGVNSSIEDFLNAVKNWGGYKLSEFFCQRAFNTFEEWEKKPNLFSFPPYFAYLIFFVYVSTIDDSTGTDSYHRKLNTILGQKYRNTRPQHSFYKMWMLWHDLEDWTDKTATLGQYSVWSLGHHDHVGIPLSQSLISNDEKLKLPCIFYKAKLSPDRLISEEALRDLLVINGESGKYKLRSPLIQFLKENHPSEIVKEEKKQAFRMFLKYIYNELSNWDGQDCDRQDPTQSKGFNTHANICLNIKRMGSNTGIRIKFSNGDSFFTTGSRVVEAENGGQRFKVVCKESSQTPWSKRLEVSDGTNKPWDIRNNTEIWENGVCFFDKSNKVIATLPECDNGIRIFCRGVYSGLDSEYWVETYRVERNCDFLIASRKENNKKLRDWGDKECDFFEEIDEAELPSFVKTWSFFRGKNAIHSLQGFNCLDIPQLVSIRLVGGLRLKGGVKNQYLQTNPPKIFLINGLGTEVAIFKVFGSSRPLPVVFKDPQIWEIPRDAPSGEPIKIEIGYIESDNNWRKVAQIRIFLIPATINVANDLPKTDRYGEIISNFEGSEDAPYLIGVKVFT